MVLAADSRGIFEGEWEVNIQHDRERKVRILAPHAAALFGGSAELGQQIIHEVEKVMHDLGAIDGATAVMNIFRDTARTCFEDWFPNLPATSTPDAPNRPELAFVLAGYDLDEVGRFTHARIYQLQSRFDFAPMQQDCGFATLGVLPYAMYLLNRLYDPGRTLDETTALAVFCVTETAREDGRVGGPVNVVTITPAGASELPRGDIEEVVRLNARRGQLLRDAFYDGLQTSQTVEGSAPDVECRTSLESTIRNT